MRIYPTMELQDGRCVTLERGRLDSPTVWHVDPVETARGFAEAGAEWMHLTDLDAVAGSDGNADLVAEIIRAAGIPVQLGGGFRGRERVETWIDRGAGRIVIGTLAATEPDLVRQIAKYHPDQIVLAVDVWQGSVMIEGWNRASAFSPDDFIAAYADVPLAGIIVTDIDTDIGTDGVSADEGIEAKLGLIAGLAGQARTPVIASGVVRTVDDIARLKYIPNISGVLVGRALRRKTVDLAEALAVARPEPEPVADFQ